MLDNPMWFHDCPDSGPTWTEAGEPCPWCGERPPDHSDATEARAKAADAAKSKGGR